MAQGAQNRVCADRACGQGVCVDRALVEGGSDWGGDEGWWGDDAWKEEEDRQKGGEAPRSCSGTIAADMRQTVVDQRHNITSYNII